MKKTITSTAAAFILFLAWNVQTAFPQECKVLSDSLAGQYEGDCKKGLAEGQGTARGTNQYTGEFKKGVPHGNGTYTWANGNIYQGDFKNGRMDGAGALTIYLEGGQQKTQKGYWKNGEYIGEYESPYKIVYKSPEVLSIRFTEMKTPENEGPALFIEIQHRGKTVSNPTFLLSETTGSFTNRFPVGVATKVLISSFPFGFTLNYMQESAEVMVYKASSWNIKIDYNK